MREKFIFKEKKIFEFSRQKLTVIFGEEISDSKRMIRYQNFWRENSNEIFKHCVLFIIVLTESR